MTSNFSYLNEKCERRKMHHGLGIQVKSAVQLAAGELVAIWGGKIVRSRDLADVKTRFTQSVMQVDEDLFILTIGSDEDADCFNHSCEPNCGMFGQVGLVAMRAIASDEEITFDYACADGGEYDEFDCSCGSSLCRKVSCCQ
jgi:hypothetical protein